MCAALSESLGDVAVVGEEVASDLRDDAHADLRRGVVAIVSQAFGREVAADQVLDWIAIGSADAHGDRYWTLDPIDGTKGFLRGEQYAVALALIERGEVAAGVLGCPNLPNADGTAGAIFVAAHDRAEMYTPGAATPAPVRVDDPASLADARMCESVEAGHSDQDQSVRIARMLGIGSEPYRIDSQCKYGVVARGAASVYLRLPTRADYVERIWDHVAGKFLVEQAGGVVTDVDGAPARLLGRCAAHREPRRRRIERQVPRRDPRRRRPGARVTYGRRRAARVHGRSPTPHLVRHASRQRPGGSPGWSSAAL